MKKVLILFCGMMISISAINAQVINDGGLEGLQLMTNISDDLGKIHGTPYLDEEFQYGTVVVPGKRAMNVFLRYNVQDENIEIKTQKNSPETYLLPANREVVYNIHNQTFVIDEIRYDGKRIAGYFIEHYDGENFRLLEKPVARISDAVKAKSSYEKDRPAEIKINSEFYIVDGQGKVENVRVKHRDVRKAFKSKPAKEYLSNNKIRSEEDLTSFVAFLDQNS